MFKCRNCGSELTDEIRFDLGWHCDYPCDTVTHDEDIQPERSKREDAFIYRPENYTGPVAIDCKPSKECDEYHKNSKVQINIKSDAVL